MTDDAKTIKLDQFEQKFFLQLNEFRRVNQYCDVRFDINGIIFPCHRLVLVTASSYFNAMFNGNFKESGSDIIPLREIEAEAFKEILNAIYTTSIRLLPSNVHFILKASHLLLLKEVENACVSYIMGNCDIIHYLVDTCLFAGSIQQKELYSKCKMTLIEDLISYGKTDSFTQIPIDVFKSILWKWKPKNYEEESTVLLILKWSKENAANCKDVHALLESSNLQFSKFVTPTLMSKLITSAFTDDSITEIVNQNDISAKMKTDSNFNLNLYLEAIDVKTGEKGWSVLKIDDEFDNYVLSSFHPTNSAYKSVCKVGSKMYCFEYFASKEQNGFFCFDENGNKTVLPTPSPEDIFQSYKLAPTGTSEIYLMAEKEKRLVLWLYNCVSTKWRYLMGETAKKEFYGDVLACTFSNGFFYIIAMDHCVPSMEHIFSINPISWNVEKMKLIPLDYKRYIVFTFGNKIALCGLDEGDYFLDIFDLESNTWFCKGTSMNVRRENFHLLHHNGFVYAVENSREFTNDKYNLETSTWTKLPSLPKRIILHDKNGDRIMATGSVFGSDSEATNAR